MAEDQWAYDRFDRPTSEWTSDDHEAELINSEAYLSLGQARADIVTPLVALLRSRHPIDGVLRHALADALEGRNRYGIPIQLKVHGQKSGRLGGKAIKELHFRRDLSIAEYIRTLEGNGFTQSKAIEEASERFLMSEAHCKISLSTLKEYERWLQAHRCAYEETFSFAPPDLRERLIRSIYFENSVWRGGEKG